MSGQALSIRRVLGIGLAWAALWLLLGLLMSVVIGIFDPDSIDDGDAQGMVMIFSLMGFLSGVLFAMATWLARLPSAPSALPVSHTAVWGVLATAIVQVAFIGHGDAGLAANVKMALLFCVFGGLIAISWLAIARALRARN
jgi:hypothetical protein